MKCLIQCQTPYGPYFLNPLHITAIEPAQNSAAPTLVRLSTGVTIDSTEASAVIASRVDDALYRFHHTQ